MSRRDPLRFAAPTLLACALSLFAVACGPPKSVPAEEIVAKIDQHYGKLVVLRGKFRSGARCHLQTEDKKWKTYCGDDCQVCRGPIVLDVAGKTFDESTDVADWPMILGGTFQGKDIRCKGKLNEIDCYPFKEGKTYVVQGMLEKQRPPKLLVEHFWEVED